MPLAISRSATTPTLLALLTCAVPLPSLSARARRELRTVRAKRLGIFSRQSSTVTRAMRSAEYGGRLEKCPMGSRRASAADWAPTARPPRRAARAGGEGPRDGSAGHPERRVGRDRLRSLHPSELHQQLLPALAQLEAVLDPLDEQPGHVAIELERLGESQQRVAFAL